MNFHRIKNELAQAWTVAVKDVRVYYLRPGMIMFGFLMPFFMFFSFSVRRELGAAEGVARLLALTVFFTAGAAGPFIIPTERRMGTYDRLMAAPMSLLTLLLGKTAVGAFFAVAVSGVALLAGLLLYDTTILQAGSTRCGHFSGGVLLLDIGIGLRLHAHFQSGRCANAQHSLALGAPFHQRCFHPPG